MAYKKKKKGEVGRGWWVDLGGTGGDYGEMHVWNVQRINTIINKTIILKENSASEILALLDQ